MAAEGIRNGVDDKDGIAPPLPSYSTEIERAWEVVEKMRDDGYVLEFSSQEGNVATFWKRRHRDERVTCGAATAPHAICLAALSALAAPTGDTR